MNVISSVVDSLLVILRRKHTFFILNYAFYFTSDLANISDISAILLFCNFRQRDNILSIHLVGIVLVCFLQFN